MKRVLAVFAVAVTLVVLAAARADAHASLEGTTPPAGTAVPTAPEQVVLTFSESVDMSPGAVRVFDREGKRVDQGRPATHPGGDHSSVALPLPPLPDGSYVVTWRVVSADSHPIHGAFTFRVGEGGTGPEATPGELAQTGGSRLVGVLYAAVRTLVFLSLLVLVGGVAFLLLLWPEGWSDRRAVRVLWAALLTAFVSTVLGVGLQAAYGAGLPLADAFKPSLVRPVLGNRIGRVWLARLVLLTGADVALTAFARRRPGAVGKALFAVLGLALLATPGLAGHAASGDLVPLAVPVDTLHLAAAALWLGGLALLLARVLPGDPEAAARIVPRFSRVAFASVVVLVLTGSFQSWRQVRELDALTATTYGRTLLVKVGLFAGLVALAGVSRLLVRRRNLAPLRTTVLAEAAVAVAVLVATSMLVSAVPARSALAQPVTKELTAGPLVVDVTVDPAKQGPATIHLYTLSPTGQVAEVQEATVQLRLPEKGVGPLDVPLQRAGPGHFAAYGFDIPLSGPWRFDVSVRTTDIDVYRAAATIRIR